MMYIYIIVASILYLSLHIPAFSPHIPTPHIPTPHLPIPHLPTPPSKTSLPKVNNLKGAGLIIHASPSSLHLSSSSVVESSDDKGGQQREKWIAWRQSGRRNGATRGKGEGGVGNSDVVYREHEEFGGIPRMER